ncbi:MAG: nitrogen fixation protein NifH [Candidatus Bathyarchaeota archaeon]|nr:nitrogen fixation protein NifH [Candidatus Bathyarchaeum sp.]
MNNWKSVLKADPTNWLLEKSNPSVQYFALTELLQKPETDPDVITAKNEIMHIGTVPKILSKQSDQGRWETPDRFYTAKYKGTVWQLIVLAALGANKDNEQVKKACEFILENSQDHESGGFSIWRSAKTGGGRHSGVIPCLTGNMVWSLIKLGFFEDPRVERAINWITRYQRFDDGIDHVPKGWPYDKATSCFSNHSCHMGAAKALKALAVIPAQKRSAEVKSTIEVGAEYFLLHHIHKRSHDLNRVSKPGWLKFSFPLMYQTDALELLDILTLLGYRDERMQEAIDLVVSKQNDSGQWLLEGTFNGRFQTNIEQKGKPSKWITLNALKVLKRFYS